MNLFQYPKDKHKRKISPKSFKRYQTYKRYLQIEFSRVCVYCRQPDSSAPNLNFGVDHYRPKGINRFANLVCEYSNLYYCCGSCNSRKQDDWPSDETKGPFVVNPCDFEMASHLRFDASTGKVQIRTPDGQHTEELLQLNDDATVQYRKNTLLTVRLLQQEIEKHEKYLNVIKKALRLGKIDQNTYDEEYLYVTEELKQAVVNLQSHTGSLPLPALRQKRKLNAVLSP